jgi:hypothetical protein
MTLGDHLETAQKITIHEENELASIETTDNKRHHPIISGLTAISHFC